MVYLLIHIYYCEISIRIGLNREYHGDDVVEASAGQAAILNAVDSAFGRLGENAKRIIYWHLENSYQIHREDIVKKPEEFIEALENMFGAGSRILVHDILAELSRLLSEDIPMDLAFAIRRISP